MVRLAARGTGAVGIPVQVDSGGVFLGVVLEGHALGVCDLRAGVIGGAALDEGVVLRVVPDEGPGGGGGEEGEGVEGVEGVEAAHFVQFAVGCFFSLLSLFSSSWKGC